MHSRILQFTILALAVCLLAGCSKKSSRLLDPVLSGPPLLITINGATLPSGPVGSTVIIEGSNFGSFQGVSGRVWFSDGVGGWVAAPISAPSDWVNDFIVTSVPNGASTGPVWVQTAGGGSDSITFTVTQNAAFSPSTINWSATTPLPVGLSGHAARFFGPPGGGVNSWVYVMGGADSSRTAQSEVIFAQVQNGGQLGSWTSTMGLPAARTFHSAALATPFNSRVHNFGNLYVLGGLDAAGTPSNVIYRGEIDSTGAVTDWTIAGALPVPARSVGVAVFHGDLYIAGGSTVGDAPVAGVYRARIDTSGALSAWQTLPSLPSARSYHSMISAGSYLYCLGGETGTVAPDDSSGGGGVLNDVAVARIDLRSGNLLAPGWYGTTSLNKSRTKHTAVLSGGYVLVSAGIYNGAKNGSSEQSYTQVDANGALGSFNGATGSQTILSAGGKNLFNHAALGYADPLGAAHVIVIGGDNLNQPGDKRREVWTY